MLNLQVSDVYLPIFFIILSLWLSSGMQYKLEKNTLQVQTYIKLLYKEEWENKISYMCVFSLMLFRASSGVGGGLHQWVCSPAGQTVGGHEWVE